MINVELPMYLLDWVTRYKIKFFDTHTWMQEFGCVQKNIEYWKKISLNNSEGAIQLLEKNPDKINWSGLSENPSAIQLLKKNPDKIIWWNLSANPSAMDLLETNPDKIIWKTLSRNPSERAMQLLEKNQRKIYWKYLFENPSIFKYDYKKMKENCMLFKKDLIKNRYHPRNISKFKDWGINGFE